MSKAKTHENYSGDWHTPPEWLEWVSETFQTADWYDPCPADWQGDKDPCGLSHTDWGAKAYCNHPGSRGSTVTWWARALDHLEEPSNQIIWCAFSVEQLRHARPSPFNLPGWLIMPRDRLSFVWGGLSAPGRVSGQPCKSPANWTVFWSSMPPAPTPTPSVVVRTGVD